MIHRSLLALALFPLLVNTATAADPGTEAASEGLVAGFAGAYVGFHGGIAVFEDGFTSDAAIADGGNNQTGAALGIHAGYGINHGAVYLGIEGDLQGFIADPAQDSEFFTSSRTVTTGSGSGGAGGGCVGAGCGGGTTLSTTVTTLTVSERYSHDVDATAAAKLRFGYDAGGFMPFATAGIAAGRVETSYLARADVEVRTNGALTEAAFVELQADEDEYRLGYTVGAGVELALPANLSLRGEYVFTDLGTRRYVFEGEGIAASTAEFDTRMHEARLGLSYRF